MTALTIRTFMSANLAVGIRDFDIREEISWLLQESNGRIR